MSIVEYISASNNSECTNVYSIYYSNPNYLYDEDGDGTKTQHNTYWPCSTENYLLKTYDQWTISSASRSRSNTWSVSHVGYAYGDRTSSTMAVRPSFYLKPTISLSGTGTKLDPYKVIE